MGRLPGEREEAFRPCPEPVSLEEALRRVSRLQSETVAALDDGQEEDGDEVISWTRTPTGVSALQREDEAIAQVFYWAQTEEETSDLPSLGTNLIPKERAIQYGSEALEYWSKWSGLSIRAGSFRKSGSRKDDLRRILQTVVPTVGVKRSLVSCIRPIPVGDILQSKRG